MINQISGDFSLANFYDVPKNWSEVQALWPCSVIWTIDFYHFNSYATFTGWCDTVPDPKHPTGQFGQETFLKCFWNSPDIWAVGPGIQTPPPNLPPPPPSPSTPFPPSPPPWGYWRGGRPRGYGVTWIPLCSGWVPLVVLAHRQVIR